MDDSKKRAGFFEKNVFVEPLKNMKQIDHLLKFMPHEVLEAVSDYMSTREDNDGEQSDVGKQLKRPIITVDNMFDLDAISDASGDSKRTVKIYDVREKKM